MGLGLVTYKILVFHQLNLLYVSKNTYFSFHFSSICKVNNGNVKYILFPFLFSFSHSFQTCKREVFSFPFFFYCFSLTLLSSLNYNQIQCKAHLLFHSLSIQCGNDSKNVGPMKNVSFKWAQFLFSHVNQIKSRKYNSFSLHLSLPFFFQV